ncbi:hypothetical protein [Streptacidiphilus rugosus]|uniref:hypothetical protein n=1 Tax=Streptacidiphilus rugosus TaxID=405783 RepID=UPI000AE5B2CF|nr:hypothetical protein [Streptacidiphilus rugosus]
MAWTDPTKAAGLLCLTCIVERKSAEAKGHPEAELPPLRPAVTLLATPHLGPCAPHCYEHIQVGTPSQLAVAGPGALAGLRG